LVQLSVIAAIARISMVVFCMTHAFPFKFDQKEERIAIAVHPNLLET
jgi:hypothetical protein